MTGTRQHVIITSIPAGSLHTPRTNILGGESQRSNEKRNGNPCDVLSSHYKPELSPAETVENAATKAGRLVIAKPLQVPRANRRNGEWVILSRRNSGAIFAAKFETNFETVQTQINRRAIVRMI